MKNGEVLIVAYVLTFVRSAITDSEKVFLKDVTSSLLKDKRSLNDLDLPDDLTFHLSRGSHALKLNLKRNYEIDPNAEVYYVGKLKDGRSGLEKAQLFEKEDIAYYQDKENGAFVTVRCVRRSNGQCDRVIENYKELHGINIPWRKHLPGYNYGDPGTRLDIQLDKTRSTKTW